MMRLHPGSEIGGINALFGINSSFLYKSYGKTETLAIKRIDLLKIEKKHPEMMSKFKFNIYH